MERWKCNYAKEPFDLKLFLLLLLKHIWIPLLGTVLCGLFAGGGYYLANIYGKPQMYEMTTVYYVNYVSDPIEGNYINDPTWNTWVDTDEFIDSIRSKVPAVEKMPKEQIKEYLSGRLEANLMMPFLTVKTEDSNLTVLLNEALQETCMEFGLRQKEIEDIRIVDTEGPKLSDPDNRMVQAFILGGVLGLFFSVLLLGLGYLYDDSVRIPATFTYRYGIPMLGTWSMGEKGTEEGKAKKELKEHLMYLLREKKQVALTGTDSDADIEAAAAELMLVLEKKTGIEGIPCVEENPQAVRLLRESEGILLLVKAGARNGKRIEKILEYLRIQDCSVVGAILWNADKKLLKAYYGI